VLNCLKENKIANIDDPLNFGDDKMEVDETTEETLQNIDISQMNLLHWCIYLHRNDLLSELIKLYFTAEGLA
jgi:hypothetical protein